LKRHTPVRVTRRPCRDSTACDERSALLRTHVARGRHDDGHSSSRDLAVAELQRSKRCHQRPCRCQELVDDIASDSNSFKKFTPRRLINRLKIASRQRNLHGNNRSIYDLFALSTETVVGRIISVSILLLISQVSVTLMYR